VRQRVIDDLPQARRAGEYLPAADHYVEAALAAIPVDAAQAAQWAVQWRALVRSQGHPPGPPVQAGSRVRTATKDEMLSLTEQLRLRDGRVPVWQVHAAAVARLLNRLADEDQ
jgi:hypothetical protein